MYQHILVPVDGSETSDLGLREAIDLARALGASIRLLHVVNQMSWIAAGAAAPAIDDLLAQARSTGECILHDAKAVVRAAGVEVESRLIEALGQRAGEMIVAEASSWPADLIVCGTHGRRGMQRILVGSDADYVVRHGPVPVLLVRGDGGARHQPSGREDHEPQADSGPSASNSSRASREPSPASSPVNTFRGSRNNPTC